MDQPREEAPQTALAEAVERVTQLEAELESASNATTATDALARAREVLHRWVDSVSGVVATPGAGRVVLIHIDGSESRIASPKLPMLLAEPVRWE